MGMLHEIHGHIVKFNKFKIHGHIVQQNVGGRSFKASKEQEAVSDG